jgi:hypothetical protein
MKRSQGDPCRNSVNDGKELVLLIIHVDDGFIVGNDKKIMNKILEMVKKKYDMEIKKGSYYLKKEIKVSKSGILISQKEYIRNKVEEFREESANPENLPMEPGFSALKGKVDLKLPYKEIIGSLIYVMSQTRPDITFSTALLSRYMNSYTADNWKAAKRILRYLGSTKELGLFYSKGEGKVNVTAYVDADFSQCKETRKSVTGYVVKLGNCTIAW